MRLSKESIQEVWCILACQTVQGAVPNPLRDSGATAFLCVHHHLEQRELIIGNFTLYIHSAAKGRNQKKEPHSLLMCYNAHKESEATR